MASSSPSFSSVEVPTKSQQCQRFCEPPYELHKAVFKGDLESVRALVSLSHDAVRCTDCHGNTPLHLSVLLGHKDITLLLLDCKPSVKEKNNFGWTPLNEAVSMGDRDIISLMVKRLHEELREGLINRRFQLIQAMKNLEDFYAELKWEFHTWVPLLSRLLPSDVCRIHKAGCCIRLDSTLGDFTEMQWSRGDISFIYDGESTQASSTLSVIALDNKKKIYQTLSLASGENIEGDVQNHVDRIMTRPIVYANMSTRPITVSRAQYGFFFFRGDRTETVGEYTTEVHNLSDLILLSRKRREHLTPEQISKWEELSKKVESGDIADELSKDEEQNNEVDHCPSLTPPPPSQMTWEEYLNVPIDERPNIGRPIDLRVERKAFKATVYMAKECPIELRKLLDILEVITPYKHFHKLRSFVDSRLPPGFPVKIEFPVFPTVTAIITLQLYEQRSSFDSDLFSIPSNYERYNSDEDDASN